MKRAVVSRVFRLGFGGNVSGIVFVSMITLLCNSGKATATCTNLKHIVSPAKASTSQMNSLNSH